MKYICQLIFLSPLDCKFPELRDSALFLTTAATQHPGSWIPAMAEPRQGPVVCHRTIVLGLTHPGSGMTILPKPLFILLICKRENCGQKGGVTNLKSHSYELQNKV